MRLDQYISVDESWFTSLTKKEQVEWIMRAKHILTRANANKLLKGVKCKPETKKKAKDGM